MFCLVPIQVNQDGFMLWLICMFLGYDMPIQLVLNHQAHNYDDRLVDHFHYVHYNNMNYIVTHYLTLMLELYNRLTPFSTCDLPIQLLFV